MNQRLENMNIIRPRMEGRNSFKKLLFYKKNINIEMFTILK